MTNYTLVRLGKLFNCSTYLHTKLFNTYHRDLDVLIKLQLGIQNRPLNLTKMENVKSFGIQSTVDQVSKSFNCTTIETLVF